MKTTHPVILGIDTHKLSHVAVAIDMQGTGLAALSIAPNSEGYLDSKGPVRLVRACRGHSWPKATTSLRSHGQIDSQNAQGAARSVLSGMQQRDPRHKQGRQK